MCVSNVDSNFLSNINSPRAGELPGCIRHWELVRGPTPTRTCRVDVSLFTLARRLGSPVGPATARWRAPREPAKCQVALLSDAHDRNAVVSRGRYCGNTRKPVSRSTFSSAIRPSIIRAKHHLLTTLHGSCRCPSNSSLSNQRPIVCCRSTFRGTAPLERDNTVCSGVTRLEAITHR